MPEGHTIHRLARRHKAMFAGHEIIATSPQGRFAEGAELVSGRVLEGTDAWGKHLFHRYTGGLFVHVHLGLYGKFADGPLPAPEPRGALRLRMEGGGQYLDLRGATRCEIVTPAEKAEITAALGKPHVQEAIGKMAMTPMVMKPAELRNFVDGEIKRWGRLIELAGIPKK